MNLTTCSNSYDIPPHLGHPFNVPIFYTLFSHCHWEIQDNVLNFLEEGIIPVKMKVGQNQGTKLSKYPSLYPWVIILWANRVQISDFLVSWRDREKTRLASNPVTRTSMVRRNGVLNVSDVSCASVTKNIVLWRQRQPAISSAKHQLSWHGFPPWPANWWRFAWKIIGTERHLVQAQLQSVNHIPIKLLLCVNQNQTIGLFCHRLAVFCWDTWTRKRCFHTKEEKREEYCCPEIDAVFCLAVFRIRVHSHCPNWILSSP